MEHNQYGIAGGTDNQHNQILAMGDLTWFFSTVRHAG
jgi:hypothetical protein